MTIETPQLERKLVAILAADVSGYSRMMHADEEGTLALLSSHRRIVDEAIERAGGRIANTAGDSVLAEFASVVAAVACAIEIQTSLGIANQPLPEDRRMLFRIGVNVGDVMMKDGGIFGDGVNVAARVEALAPPGGICVTRGVRDHVRDRLACRFEDIGQQLVKNIARPVRVYRVAPELAQVEPADVVELEPLADGPSALAPIVDSPDTETIFWTSAEASGSITELNAYLERYPDGAFASLARHRIAEPSAGPTDLRDHEVELAFWETVRDSDDAAMFEAYVDRYPDGSFRPLAEIRIASLGANAVPIGTKSA